MTGTKFLSDVVNLDALKNDHLNIIKAPTGSGKTYFALTAIPATLTDAVHQVVYLIDTINGMEQILKNYNARSFYRGWDVEVCIRPDHSALQSILGLQSSGSGAHYL